MEIRDLFELLEGSSMSLYIYHLLDYLLCMNNMMLLRAVAKLEISGGYGAEFAGRLWPASCMEFTNGLDYSLLGLQLEFVTG